jgi:capsid protein
VSRAINPMQPHPMVAALANYAQGLQASWASYPSTQDPRARFGTPAGGNADYHLDAKSRRLAREKSRALERGNMFYDGLLGNFCDLIVGADGPEPMWVGGSGPIDPVLAAEIREAWWDDAAACRLDVSRVLPWGEWTSTLLRSIVRDGEMVTWRNGSGAALMYESDLIGHVAVDKTTGQITEIRPSKLSKDGKPASWFYGDVPDEKSLGPALPLSQTTLSAWRTRARQTRGAPVAIATLDKWERLSSLLEAEVISAEAGALPWVVLNTQAGAAFQDLTPSAASTLSLDGTGDPNADAPDTLTPAGWQSTDAGSMMAPPPGVTATPWSPNRPNLNVPEFVKAALRFLCLPLMPYEVAFSDISGLSYAAVRGLGKLANQRAKRWQANILQPAIDPIAEEWLAARGFRRPVGARLEWRWPAIDIRDREKDAASAEREIKLGINSRTAILGPDAALIRDQLAQEASAQDSLDVARIAKLNQEVEQVAVPALNWATVLNLGGSAPVQGPAQSQPAPDPAGSQPDSAGNDDDPASDKE